MEWLRSEIDDVKIGLSMSLEPLSKRAKKLNLTRLDTKKIALGACAVGAVSMLAAGSSFILKEASRIQQAEQDAVEEQARTAIRGFHSVNRVIHEQPLMPGDKDRVVIELAGGKSCTIVLSMAGNSPAYPEVADWGDCPLK